MAKDSVADEIKARMRRHGIDLDKYISGAAQDLGHTMRGIDFKPKDLIGLVKAVGEATDLSGHRVFLGGEWQDTANLPLKYSFLATNGMGYREARDGPEHFDPQIYPEGHHDLFDRQLSGLFATSRTAISGGSLHLALHPEKCNIHVDESICFMTGEAVGSPDTPQHIGNELVWHDKLAPRLAMLLGGGGGLYLGIVGGGALGNSVGGGHGRSIGGLLGGVALGAAGTLAGYYLNKYAGKNLLHATDYVHVVLPNSGNLFARHAGIQFESPTFNMGPVSQVYMTVNLLYDVDLNPAGSLSLSGHF